MSKQEFSESLFRQIADSSPIATLIAEGLDERVHFLNQRFTDFFGYTQQDFQDVNQWWTIAYPEELYREHIKQLWSTQAKQAILNHGTIAPVEAVITCKDGSTRYAEVTMTSFGTYHVVFFKDWTLRKRSQDSADLLQAFFIDINKSSNFQTAINEVTQTICKKNGWTKSMIWHVDLHKSKLVNDNQEQAPGEGAVGKAWAMKQSVIKYSDENKHSAILAIPIIAEEEVVSVLEFFVPDARSEEDFKMKTVASLTQQMGTLFETRITEDELNAANERTARLAIAASDLANTPLQTLLYTTELLRRGQIDSDMAVPIFENGLRRLISISEVFRRSLSSIRWSQNDLGFDPWKIIQNELKKIDRTKKS